MHQTKYRGIITEAGSLTFPPWEPAEPLLAKLLRKYVSPYFKDLQSAVVLKLNAELKVSFPAYLNVFKVTTQTSLKLLEAYPLAGDMLAAPRDELVETIRKTARFGEKYAISKYDAICAAA